MEASDPTYYPSDECLDARALGPILGAGVAFLTLLMAAPQAILIRKKTQLEIQEKELSIRERELALRQAEAALSSSTDAAAEEPPQQSSQEVVDPHEGRSLYLSAMSQESTSSAAEDGQHRSDSEDSIATPARAQDVGGRSSEDLITAVLDVLDVVLDFIVSWAISRVSWTVLYLVHHPGLNAIDWVLTWLLVFPVLQKVWRLRCLYFPLDEVDEAMAKAERRRSMWLGFSGLILILGGLVVSYMSFLSKNVSENADYQDFDFHDIKDYNDPFQMMGALLTFLGVLMSTKAALNLMLQTKAE